MLADSPENVSGIGSDGAQFRRQNDETPHNLESVEPHADDRRRVPNKHVVTRSRVHNHIVDSWSVSGEYFAHSMCVCVELEQQKPHTHTASCRRRRLATLPAVYKCACLHWRTINFIITFEHKHTRTYGTHANVCTTRRRPFSEEIPAHTVRERAADKPTGELLDVCPCLSDCLSFLSCSHTQTYTHTGGILMCE